MLKHMLWGVVVMTSGYVNSMGPKQESLPESAVREPSQELVHEERTCDWCEWPNCQGPLPGWSCNKRALAHLPVSRSDQNISIWYYSWKHTDWFNNNKYAS